MKYSNCLRESLKLKCIAKVRRILRTSRWFPVWKNNIPSYILLIIFSPKNSMFFWVYFIFIVLCISISFEKHFCYIFTWWYFFSVFYGARRLNLASEDDIFKESGEIKEEFERDQDEAHLSKAMMSTSERDEVMMNTIIKRIMYIIWNL